MRKEGITIEIITPGLPIVLQYAAGPCNQSTHRCPDVDE